MSAVPQLRQQGLEIPSEVLSGISPYWTEHINRFGIFELDMQKSIRDYRQTTTSFFGLMLIELF